VSYSIHPDAEAELGDAAVYYAAHASGMIALAFLAEYQRVRDLLVENQRRGSHREDGLRAYHFDRFPYTVSSTKKTNSAARRSSPSRSRAVNPAIGVLESKPAERSR
jgi:plasmid stabilization system protein ParE